MALDHSHGPPLISPAMYFLPIATGAPINLRLRPDFPDKAAQADFLR